MFKTIPRSKNLRIHCLAPAMIRWTFDEWKSMNDAFTLDTGIGIHYADLTVAPLLNMQKVIFTFYWQNTGNWENSNYSICIEKDPVYSVKNDIYRDKIGIFFPS